MGFLGRHPVPRIPSNIDLPGVTFVDGDHIEFTEEYLDKCMESSTQLLTKDMGETLDKKGVAAGSILISATLKGDERYHSLWILFKAIHDLRLDFNIVKEGDNIYVQIEHIGRNKFFPMDNKRRIGKINPDKPDKVYSYVPDKVIKYIPHHDYAGKEVPRAMEYDLTENKLKIYTGIVGRSVSEYKLIIVDVGVWVSEPEMKATIEAVTGLNSPSWMR